MEKITSALAYISSTERETWVRMGMAIKQELGDAGFDLWNYWSSSAPSYKEKDAIAVWRSIRPAGKVTMGSLYHVAKVNGWRDDGKFAKPTQAQIDERNRLAAERLTEDGMRREAAQAQAAKKAAWILHQCKSEAHAYLHSKGFGDDVGRVWWASEDSNLLCVPMYVNTALVGIQLINRLGEKKFLTGQRTAGAYHLINNDGYGADNWFTEGYANALSLRACLKSMSRRYKIYVCFSAHNMKTVATMIGSGYVIADREKSGVGERIAEEIGLPYWIPFDDNTDFNDYWKANGTFKTATNLRAWMNNLKKV